MKKIIPLILALCMLITIVSGCATTAAPGATTTVAPAAGETTAAPEAETYTIIYDANYGETPDSTAEIAAGEPIYGSVLPRFGFKFSGWYTDEAATTAIDKATTLADKDMTLYAGWTAWDATTQGYMDIYQQEMHMAKYITNRPSAFTAESFDAYYEIYFSFWLAIEAGKSVVNEKSMATVEALKAARLALVATANDPDSTIYYIWGDQMASSKDVSMYGDFGYFDNTDFKPFLVPYLAADQSTVMATIIVIAGGGFFLRNNYEEAYTTAKDFQSRGYNAFVLQRRVQPYNAIDSSLDLQRSIRYLKANAATMGISGTDKIVACGFSGGGGTILGTVDKLYGDVSPTTVDPSYVPDAVDAINSDLNAMLLIYGALSSFGADGAVVTNPNIPSAFIVTGSQDMPAIQAGSWGVYNYLLSIDPEAHAELHAFSQAPHGFGLGQGIGDYFKGYVGADNWSQLADDFLQVEFGYQELKYYPG